MLQRGKVGVHDACGNGNEPDLAVVCGDGLSAKMSSIEIEVLMMINEGEGNSAQS